MIRKESVTHLQHLVDLAAVRVFAYSLSSASVCHMQRAVFHKGITNLKNKVKSNHDAVEVRKIRNPSQT